MRRLLVLVSAIVLVDTMLYAALVPLLPGYAEEFGLSKGAAGLLVAAFAVGALGGAVPAGAATARFGPRRAVVAGLALMSLASLGFGFAGDVWTLGLARLLQGIGSTVSWTAAFAWLAAAAPRERRGELMGTAIGAAIGGALLGPVLGGVAGLVGTRPAFSAVAGFGALLLAWSLRTPSPGGRENPLRGVVTAVRERRFLFALWLMLLPALLFGVLAVLVPLELGRHGWGPAAVGAVFLVATAGEALLAPLAGRVSDRRGRLLPVRAALLGSVVVSLALAAAPIPIVLVALTVLAAAVYGVFWVPASALVGDGAERVGLSHGVAYALANAAWGIGALTGPALGGALADVGGDALPFAAAGLLCLTTFAALERSRRPLALST